jgi:hypothetical protein
VARVEGIAVERMAAAGWARLAAVVVDCKGQIVAASDWIAPSLGMQSLEIPRVGHLAVVESYMEAC